MTFGLWLGRAECKFLGGNLDIAEQLIDDLLAREASKVDQATVYQLKVRQCTVKGDYSQAVDGALTCLRVFGIHLPAHPSQEDVQAEYETRLRFALTAYCAKDLYVPSDVFSVATSATETVA